MIKSTFRTVAVTVLVVLCSLVPALLLATTAEAAPVPASAPASAPGTTATAARSHSGLSCRSHKAETNGPAGRVNVPKSYCYDPDTTTNPGWHDYCTHSPDTYYSANFRGPCAYHDLCLAAGTGHKACDPALLVRLRINCDFAYSKINPLRYSCRGRAATYYAAIKIWTH